MLVMLWLIHLVALIFDKCVLKCLEWLLFLLFEALLVEWMIYTTDLTGFCCLYSGTYGSSYYCLNCYVIPCTWCHWSYWSVIHCYVLNVDVTINSLGFYVSVRENNEVIDIFWKDFKWNCKNLVGPGQPGKSLWIYLWATWPRRVWHHVGTRWRSRHHETCLAAQCSECDILFPSQLHVLSVGRDTEL